MADLTLILAEAAEAAEPSALGLTPPMWVALSMAVLIVIMLWLKVPGVLTKGWTRRSRKSASSSMKPRRCAPTPKR
jgi:hypothetical protein